MKSVSLSDVLFTRTQQKILGLLYTRIGESLYLNEIVRRAGMGKGTIKRELERMQASGLLIVRRIGNQNHYSANPDCPIYHELMGIVRKTFGIADVLREALQPIIEKLDWACVYGSVAKKEDNANSDIDLLVVADDLPYADLMALLTSAEESLGRTINPSIYDLKQLRKKLKQKNAFLTRVMEQPKLWVKGNDDDIKVPG